MQCVAMQYNAIQCAALHHQLPMLRQFVFTLQYLEVWIVIQSPVLFMCLSPLNDIRIIGTKCTCDCAGDTDNHCNCNLKFMLFQVVANNLNQNVLLNVESLVLTLPDLAVMKSTEVIQSFGSVAAVVVQLFQCSCCYCYYCYYCTADCVTAPACSTASRVNLC